MQTSSECTAVPRPARMLVAMQALLVAAIVPVCALAPQPHGASLLLPLPGFEPGPAATYARAHGLQLIGHGRMRGSLVVAGAGPERLGDALCAGFLLIHAPELLCGPAQTNP